MTVGRFRSVPGPERVASPPFQQRGKTLEERRVQTTPSLQTLLIGGRHTTVSWSHSPLP